MPEIHVPFTHGVQEGVDPKLLPDGWLSRAENVRFRKDGRLGSRFGYASLSAAGISAGQMLAAGNLGPLRSVYVRERQSSTVPGFPFDRRDTTGGIAICGSSGSSSSASSVSTLGVPRRISVFPNEQYSIVSSDVAVASNGNIHVVAHDYDSTNQLNRGVIFACLNGTTQTAMATYLISADGTNPKIVVCGNVTVVVYALTTDDNIYWITFDQNGSFSAAGVIVAAQAARSFAFDIAANTASTFLLVYEPVTSTHLSWGTVTTAGVLTIRHNITSISNNAVPSITLMQNGNVAVVWIDSSNVTSVGDVSYMIDTVTGSAVTAPTSLETGHALGFPVAGRSTTDNYAFAWSRDDGSMSTVTGTNIPTISRAGWLTPVSKPVMGPNNACYLWCSNYSTTGLVDAFATYKLIDIASVGVRAEGVACDAIACQLAAMPGARAVSKDTRRNAAQVTSILTNVPSSSATAIVVCLPVIANGRYGADLIRIDSSPFADRLLPANINGQLFFSGARLYEFDGRLLYESGLGHGPEYTAVADAGAGTIGAGTYQYVITWQWRDITGRRHQSPPSTPQSITIADNHNVTVSFGGPAFSGRMSEAAGLVPGVTFNVWRTLAGGTIFHLVNSTSNVRVTATVYDKTIYTYSDSSTDATIEDNEVLYTQGVRGGLSGLLPNDEPPPCRFIWAGNNRLIMGGLEQASEVQWSKLVFPGEPVQFADDPAFKARIDGEVMGVACLDGIWYVGSRESIFTFQGDGPDDTGGGGDFGDPRRLPADVGFYAQRSIVEVPQGLLFQGRADRIYLLPRGGGAPQWVGQNVRATLALYPIITAAKLVAEENVVVFSCMNTTGTDGVLLVYDTRIGEWTVDIPFNGAAATNLVFRCLDVFNGKLIIDGQIAQTAAYSDDEDGAHNRAIVSTFVTGDMRPFGVLGHGRFRRFVLLSEYRSATTFTIEESVDGGVTYQTAASFTPSNSAGDTVKVQYDLPIVRGEAYRFRIISTPTSPGEGFVFNSLTGEVYPDKGTPRLANAYRG